jgi:hypothetical protein
MIISAERRFSVRIRIGVPPEMTSWLDEKLRRRRLGHHTVRGARGAQCFLDATFTSAFVVRWLQN